jgi:Ni/Co efflux regulator RcnB
MHKALMGIILAATAMTPIAAQAQDSDRSEHYQRLERRNQQRHEQRQQRQEARQERQEARQQRSQPSEPSSQGEVQRSEVARERSHRARGDVQRSLTAQEQQVLRRQRFESRGGDGQRLDQRSTEFQRVESTSDGQASQAWQGDPNDPRRQRYERLERRNQWRHGTPEQRDAIRQDRGSERGDWRRGDRDGRDWRRGDRDWRRDWNRDWRRDRRYDWTSWRGRNRSIFRLSRYYSPYRNWGYNRFSIGFFLPSLFYSQRYWVGDPWQYRLPHAPPGTQWVRYYNDVLLVDTWTGEVVDVIYDFFW